MPAVCVDANLILAWLLPSQNSPTADAARDQLLESDVTLVGPPLLYVEVPSVIHSQVQFRGIRQDEADAAFNAFCELGIETLRDEQLPYRAWRIATELGMPRLYDAQYLAAADLLDCELWTMDKRLINAVSGRFRHLRPIR